MPDRSPILFALVLVGATALSSLAQAEDYITVNGLPCGAFCRTWMGVKLPSETPPARAVPENFDESREAEPSLRPAARREYVVEHRAAKTAKAARSSSRPAAQTMVKPPPSVGLARRSVTEPKIAAPSVAASKPMPPVAASPETKAPVAHLAPETPAVAPETPAVASADKTPVVAVAPAPVPVASEVPVTPPPVAASADTKTAGASVVPETPADKNPAAAASAPPVAENSPPAEAPGSIKPAAPKVASAKGDGDKPTLAEAPAPQSVAPTVAMANPSGPPDDGRRTLIVLTKADVKEVADLHDKAVVIAVAASISDARLKAAFEAAGASGAEFRQGAVNDVDEVATGQVAAAIVAVVQPAIASAFPDVPGYRVLRVEVAPEASR